MDAVAVLDEIAAANPASRHPVHDLVELLQRAGQITAIPRLLQVALALRPGDAGLWAALGAALSEHGEAAAMVGAFRRATQLRPGEAAAWSNLGKALAAAGDDMAAEDAFARSARLAPADAQLRLNHAVARLRTGRLAEGWPLFRARHALAGRAPPPPGPELTNLAGVSSGETVVLVHDEGFGDTIQFIRFVPLLAAKGVRVVSAVPPPLQRLLVQNGMALAGAADQGAAWCRIPDLPAVFGTEAGTIPATLPYLAADPAAAAAWARRLPAGRRVGLVWAGGARAHDPAAAATDRVRSLRRERVTPLLAVPGITWVSLQHGQTAPVGVSDPMPEVQDFADTAAIIAGLDLVVSVDTAVAHLAAAMGRPVLLLDRFDNCWRWMRGRVDSPWYPGVLHIIRQSRPGDWDGVLQRAATLLREEANWPSG